jgi:hypothetical protein
MKLLFENWRQYMAEQYEMKDTGVKYTALVLDDPADLVSKLKEQGVEIPEDWKGLPDFPHHMTILSPVKQKYRYPAEYLNQPGEVTVTGYAMDDKVLAITVTTDLPTKQDIPHITVAVSPTGYARDTNELLATTEPTDLESFTVKGIIKEVPK